MGLLGQTVIPWTANGLRRFKEVETLCATWFRPFGPRSALNRTDSLQKLAPDARCGILGACSSLNNSLQDDFRLVFDKFTLRQFVWRGSAQGQAWNRCVADDLAAVPMDQAGSVAGVNLFHA
jgi:hypothetical protein